MTRRERANKLLQYGLIVEYLGLEEIAEEIILGYLFCFEKDKINISDNNENIKFTLKRYDKLVIENLSYFEKKERNSFLIKRGALFEISNTLVDFEKLFNYLIKLENESKEKIDLYKKTGKHYFDRVEM